MKTWTKFMVVAFSVCFFLNNAYSQTGTTKPKTTSKTHKAPAKKTAPPLSRKDITITLINSDEHSVSFFAGAKADLKTPKLKFAGGLSTNTLYVKENDVVCIMDDSHKPTACIDVPPGTKSVQINSSGNGLTRK